MPFIWSLPEALMTAELSCAFPEASGSVVWVEKAFGPFAGWIDGCLTWAAGATDLGYLIEVIQHSDLEHMNGWIQYGIVASMSLVLSYVNYRGLPVVGNMSISICAMAMSPFVVLCIWGIPQIKTSRWFETPQYQPGNDMDFNLAGGLFPNAVFGGVLLRPFLNNLFWNLNSFDSAGNFAEDVKNPARMFPRAMLGAVFFVLIGYLLPLLVAIGASDAAQSEWHTGYLAAVSEQIGGRWLGAWLVFGAAISNLGQFEAELSSDSFMIMGMADRGYVPKFLSHRSSYGTPTFGILICTLVILICITHGMATLIEMENFCYALSLIMEYAAFLKLRITDPDCAYL
eukprot:CAMPEP_0116825920 /NCGR_PEP_ID=MMETSP0418-20121206/2244_1 /TAXON_ID=1158023 /ORGANISM="Astrosyne radiata, Strain 13vi08-1A" /LENGTH=342 /DNA_ID=CAMNT_0004454503 /DNA_START=1 /DNA_END=1029 /DNA_ORIENTATION=-